MDYIQQVIKLELRGKSVRYVCSIMYVSPVASTRKSLKSNLVSLK